MREASGELEDCGARPILTRIEASGALEGCGAPIPRPPTRTFILRSIRYYELILPVEGPAARLRYEAARRDLRIRISCGTSDLKKAYCGSKDSLCIAVPAVLKLLTITGTARNVERQQGRQNSFRTQEGRPDF